MDLPYRSQLGITSFLSLSSDRIGSGSGRGRAEALVCREQMQHLSVIEPED